MMSNKRFHPGVWLSLAILALAILPLNGFRNADVINTNRPPNVDKYLRNYRYLAVNTHKNTGIPLTIIMAIAGLESQWGSSEMAKACNNHFGLKDTDWPGPVYCKNTTEYFPATGQVTLQACFRKYELIADSYHDFGHFLTTRKHYRHCFYYPDWDYRAWAYGLQYGGYATDPHYAEKLVDLIERYRLYEL